MAIFKVNRRFTLSGRGDFVLSGEITEGVIRIGMSICLITDTGAPARCEIEAIESFLISASTGESEVGLVLLCASDEELAMLGAAQLVGKSFDIS